MVNTADDEWKCLLGYLINTGQSSSPRGQGTCERIGVQTKVNMQQPIITNVARNMGYKFMCAEAWWILTGQRDLASITEYASMIKKFSDDGYQFDGAYGPMVQEQMRYVVDTLVADHDSRQAVITIWRPNPRSSKDIPCTVSLQFLIRPDQYDPGLCRIHCVANMRSSDAWLGWVYDVFNFTMITTYIGLRVMEIINRDGLDTLRRLELGFLHLNIGSSHIYDRNFEACKKAVECVEYIYTDGISLSSFENPRDLIHQLDWCKDNIQVKDNRIHNGLG